MLSRHFLSHPNIHLSSRSLRNKRLTTFSFLRQFTWPTSKSSIIYLFLRLSSLVPKLLHFSIIFYICRRLHRKNFSVSDFSKSKLSRLLSPRTKTSFVPVRARENRILAWELKRRREKSEIGRIIRPSIGLLKPSLLNQTRAVLHATHISCSHFPSDFKINIKLIYIYILKRLYKW